MRSIPIFFFLFLVGVPAVFILYHIIRYGWKGGLLFQKRIQSTFETVRYQINGRERSVTLHNLESGDLFGLEIRSMGSQYPVIISAKALAELGELISRALHETKQAEKSPMNSVVSAFNHDNPYSSPPSP